jgi:double-stranded uracil-DNA glycosylase
MHDTAPGWLQAQSNTLAERAAPGQKGGSAIDSTTDSATNVVEDSREMSAPSSGDPAVPRPTRAELAAAYGRRIPDVGGPGIQVLLVGINPSLWSGWSGHHFARPGNRLWRTLHEAGFTATVLRADDTAGIRAAGLGITNLVADATARAEEVDREQITAGLRPLRALIRAWRPGFVAFLGISTYRVAFAAPRAGVGPVDEPFEGAEAWVLPNPSGLNAHYQQPDLTAAYARLAARVRDSVGPA